MNFSSKELAAMAQQLDASGVSWGVFAGAAAYIWGSQRPLNDIDILIPSDAGKRIFRYFPEANVEVRQDQSIASLHLLDIEIIAGLTQNIHLGMDDAIISRISRHKLLGVDLAVLSVEDNIVFKAVKGRGPDVGKYDWEDIAAMLQNHSNFDWDYAYWRLEKCVQGDPSKIIARLETIRQCL